MRKILLLALCLVASVTVRGQLPGQNVNMVTGKTFPGGDPWLQKQNEPSGAVSTVNPCHILAGANDYRAVNVAGLPADKEIGDAWVGWYTSINCGQTWYSTLVPGYLQDTSAAGKSSPAYGLTTAGDSTVRAGRAGFFGFSFMAYNRGTNYGKLLLARFLDRNTREAVTKPETAISYVDTIAWDTGAMGQLIDKPFMIVTPGTGTCTLLGKVIPATTVHMAWTVFVGNSDTNIRTKVYYARSSNCGATLDGPATKLSETYAVTQSANIVSAANGALYVVWRQFSTTKGDPNQILIAKSVDGGKSFTKGTPLPIASFLPADQGTSSKTFRTNTFPASATDRWGRLYVALSIRGFAQDPVQARVVVMSTMDGLVWTMPQAIENGDSAYPGHQIMPAITSAGGNLNVVWLDFRDDISGHHDQFIKEIYPIRHSMDVRGAQAKLQENGNLSWNSYGILQEMRPAPTVRRISRYITGDYTNESDPFQNPLQLQWNRPNLKLYAGGTRPFIGDFIDVAGLDYLVQEAQASLSTQTTTTQAAQTTTWVLNDGSNPALATTAAQTFYAFWTDNRDAKVSSFPAEPNSSDETVEGSALPYVAPGTAACAAAGPNPPTKSRNANVYSSRITPGVFVAAPTNSKPSINSRGRIQRAFPVLVQNRTNQDRRFRITIANQPPDFGSTGVASLTQIPSPIPSPLPAPIVSAEVIIPANSGVSRTVYVVSSVKFPRIRVNVDELGVAQPLTGSTILNLDNQNADIENADIENADPQNADIENNEIHNADIENADIENADIENADIENADIENADIENADIENADIENADIENADIENADIENADIENADIENGAISDYSVDLENHGNTSTTYQVKVSVNGDTSPYLFQLIGRRVYKTPTAVGCELRDAGTNQILFKVNLDPTDLAPGPVPNPLDPSTKNATVLVAPGEHIKVTLRAVDKDALTGATAPPNDGIQPFCPLLSPICPVVTNEVTVTVASVSSNTGDNTPPVTTFPSTPPVPFTLVVTNTNDSGPGSLRQAIITANNHIGFADTISFNIRGTGVHTITPLSPLPALAEPAIIAGTTQPGYTGSPLIELDGTNAGTGAVGLVLTGGSTTGSAVFGLAINRFAGNGITLTGNFNVVQANHIGTDAAGVIDLGNLGNGIQIIDGANNRVGGPQPAVRNIVSGNQGEGIRIDGVLSTGNIIQGNFVGTNAAGTGALGNNNSGIYIRRAPGNSVIGNVVSGNTGFAGIAICANATGCGGGFDTGNPADGAGNIIQGNLVGTNALGTAPIGNAQRGVSIDGAPNTLVGGPLASHRNVISATVNGPGVVQFNPGADGNLIRNNYIGTDASGTCTVIEEFGCLFANNGPGVELASGTNTVVSGRDDDSTAPNVIMFNRGDGILVSGGTSHKLRVNRFDLNDGLGIADNTDGTGGLPSAPTLTLASLANGVVNVQGTVARSFDQTLTVDLYASNACDPSGFGEGRQWFGAFTVASGEGLASFNMPFGGNVVVPGQVVTALATFGDQTVPGGVNGSTSEFSNCETAGTFLATLSDPAGDATPNANGVSPDLVETKVIQAGTDLIFEVRFEPGTFDPATTRASLVLDTDQNAATGHPGVDASCANDAALLGLEYQVDAPSGQVYHYSGCRTFTLGGVGAVTTAANGFDIRIGLALLGGDDGVLNFKVLTQRQISPGGSTGILDYMSNIGSAVGSTGGGGGVIFN
ncbi:MAG TPA: pentapeptide repeat-containing protein [Vicinamibacterales bacterium]|nr:pentapeptide repeat-containing protein [Vicinamibacterales bacterium]